MWRLTKKFFSLSGSALAVLILSGFLSLRPITGGGSALAQYVENCQDIGFSMEERSRTDAVFSPDGPGRIGGVPDSGTFDFNEPAREFQACVEATERMRNFGGAFNDGLFSGGTDVTGNFLKGWVWNTNLGFMSFSCEKSRDVGDASIGENLGTDNCGTIDYGSVVLPAGPGDSDSRRIRGFAYGDNIGWVSMGCDAGTNVAAGDCGDASTNYGVRVATAEIDVSGGPFFCLHQGNPGGKLSAGDLYGYAWADSVGWMNMCGAHTEISAGFTVDPADPTVDVVIVPGTDVPQRTLAVDAGVEGAPFANGEDFYEISIRLSQNGAPVDGATADVSVSIEPTFSGLVKADQVACAGADCPAATDTSATQWDAARGVFYARLTSVAPTNLENALSLTGLTVRVLDGSDTVQLLDLNAALAGRFGITEAALTTAGQSLAFRPAIKISQIMSYNEAGDLQNIAEDENNRISAINNGSQELTVHLRREAPLDTSPSLINQLYDCSEGEYDFVFDDNQNQTRVSTDGAEEDRAGFDVDGTASIQPAAPVTDICFGSDDDFSDSYTVPISFDAGDQPQASVTAFVFSYPEADATIRNFANTDSLGLQFTITYVLDAKVVRYYDPEAIRGNIVSQAADIRGNVRIDVVETGSLPSGGISGTLGERAQSKREPFYRAIKNLVGRSGRSYGTGSDGGEVVLGSTSLEPEGGNAGNGLYYFDKNNLEVAADTDAPCEIILRNDDGNDITFAGNTTLVSEGCNVFIDQNIMPSQVGSGRLGIIALEDLSITDENKRGGNIYICNLVTDIEANLVADGSVRSYGRSLSNCGLDATDDSATPLINSDGTPNLLLTFRAPRELLKHQLAIIGSMSISKNTYGGSAAQTQCDGSRAITLEERTRARYCDINLWRYAKVRENLDEATRNNIDNPDASVPYCWATDDPETPTDEGIKLSKTFSASQESDDGACFENSEDERNVPSLSPQVSFGRGVVNIIYRAPSADMPVFNKVAQSR